MGEGDGAGTALIWGIPSAAQELMAGAAGGVRPGGTTGPGGRCLGASVLQSPRLGEAVEAPG